jgi:hypothetical protein
MIATPRNEGLNDINDEIKEWNEILGNQMAEYEDFF